MDALGNLDMVLPYQKLNYVLREICQPESESKENWSSLVDSALKLSESLTHTLCTDVDKKNELEKLVVQLWNKTVVLKTAGTIQTHSYGKLRHVAYQVISFLNESSGDVSSLQKQVMMGIKAARAWIDVKELQYADGIINSVQETIQKLQRSYVERKNTMTETEDLTNEIGGTEKDYFCVLCLKAEVKFALNLQTEAMAAVKKAEEILSKFPAEAFNLSMLCYNFGVDCYQLKQFESGILWLRESWNINKDVADPNPKTQARTLRLLANCYLEAKCENWMENALNAVSLANQKHCHIAGLYVRLQLLLESEETDAALQHGLGELLDHPSCDLNMCTNALKMFKTFQRPDAIFEWRHNILVKYERHLEYPSLLVSLMDLFLQATEMVNASTFAEECIKAHNTGHRLDGMPLKQFHIIFWMKAAQYFEKEKYDKAAQWYNYSLSLYPSLSVTEPNLAKLQRNLANCYLSLGDTSKASTAIEVAERYDKRDAHTQFIIFKIALEQNDTEKATNSVKELVSCIDSHTDQAGINIICLVAHTALEKQCCDLAVISLECLITHSDDDKHVLTALKCLLRLLVEDMEANNRVDKKSLLCHIRTAYNRIIGARDRGRLASAEIEEESSWFMKIAWNLALRSKTEPFCMKEFFNLCIQLLSLCPASSANFQRHQSCLLISCAACLQLAREPQDKTHMQNFLEEVLQHIQEFRRAEKRTDEAGWIKTSASTEMFLLLYEFEALAKLKDVRAESVLDKALTIPNPSAKLFHTFSVLAMDSPANNKRLSVRALKVAIRLHLQLENPDFVSCSADVRNLISMSLVLNEKEAMVYYKETLDMVEKRAKDKYPEMELLWLMTRAWNWGLQHYNCEKLMEAEQWCSLSMRILKFIPQSRDEYQEQMMSVYGEILNRFERTEQQNDMEE